jgi:ribulose-phosphate 3-epimerase
MFKLAPSILSADFGRLSQDIEMVNNSQADWFHVDIMDGVFVPNISFGFPVMKTLAKEAKKPLDVHLMIVDPDRYIERFAVENTYLLTVHYEACTHLHRTINEIKKNGMKAGVAINPHTPVNLLYDILQDLDLVLIMSVNPGFAAQKFIENTYSKISRLKKQISENKLNVEIEVDGGVNLNNFKKLADAGADVLVAGNAVFGEKSPTDTIKKFKNN